MAQQTLEEIIPLFFKKIANATGIKTFGYSGGVASNIKVNRLIRNLPEVERLEICPAMGDGGLALGAALAVWQKVTGNKPDTFSDFKLGTDYGDLGKEAEKIAQETNSDLKLPTDIAQLTAEYIAKGEVVMWAQGRMELGARALGARSIIARADSTIARDDLNLRLKRRVWFQPFCPTILAEEAPKLLTDYRGPQDLNLHMTSGFLTTELGRKTLAGAIGPDGSCRPQMVENNPKDVWCNLLTHLQKLTGIGAIINTSLNMHGKPMANDTAGIVAAWLESDIQHLALGSAFLTKTPNTPKNDQR
jgi:carbamoyltransferase